MGFGELREWAIGKIKLTNHKRDERFGFNPFGRRRIYIIPLFHRTTQNHQAPINIYNFSPALAG